MIKGYKRHGDALKRARDISTSPEVRALRDGSFVAIGDTLLMSNGSRTRVVFGAYGTTTDTASAPEELWG